MKSVLGKIYQTNSPVVIRNWQESKWYSLPIGSYLKVNSFVAGQDSVKCSVVCIDPDADPPKERLFTDITVGMFVLTVLTEVTDVHPTLKELLK